VQLDVFNLLNTRASQIDYFYESQLRGEAGPVSDVHFHPVESRSFRAAVIGNFQAESSSADPLHGQAVHCPDHHAASWSAKMALPRFKSWNGMEVLQTALETPTTGKTREGQGVIKLMRSRWRLLRNGVLHETQA